MKLTHMMTATAAIALLGGAAVAQTKNEMPKGPTPGSVTGDWNGAHAPSDDKQYQEKVVVKAGSATTVEAAPQADAGAFDPPAASTADTTAVTDASATAPAVTYTSTMVTNGPVPDTAENRAKYGQPLSRAGKMTAARGN